MLPWRALPGVLAWRALPGVLAWRTPWRACLDNDKITQDFCYKQELLYVDVVHIYIQCRKKSTGRVWVLIINKGSADSVLSSNRVQYST